jgi:hypothetical protein
MSMRNSYAGPFAKKEHFMPGIQKSSSKSYERPGVAFAAVGDERKSHAGPSWQFLITLTNVIMDRPIRL